MNEKQAEKESIFKIGRVIAVKGRLVEIQVDKTKNTSYLLYDGNLLKNVSVGGYIKITKGFTKIICKVDGERIEEEKFYSEKEYKNKQPELE